MNKPRTVVKNGRIDGVITLKDMLEFLALKSDLEGEDLKITGDLKIT